MGTSHWSEGVWGRGPSLYPITPEATPWPAKAVTCNVVLRSHRQQMGLSGRPAKNKLTNPSSCRGLVSGESGPPSPQRGSTNPSTPAGNRSTTEAVGHHHSLSCLRNYGGWPCLFQRPQACPRGQRRRVGAWAGVPGLSGRPAQASALHPGQPPFLTVSRANVQQEGQGSSMEKAE